ncbi:hypothetical protein [Streptomyces sp. NPDC059850]|uniref:hypothetical protein n=1 Tax=Streptomyces sp. NPDC059850 TaxID=3346970 RepID=UPI00366406FB
MSEGIYTLAGAVVGGLIGVVGTVAAARLTGRDQREHWRRQVRRDAYSTFIVRAGEALRVGRATHEAARVEEPGVMDAIKELEGAVSQVEEAATLVALEGPEEIADVAANIYFRLDAWPRALCTAYSGPVDRQDDAWERARISGDEAEDGLEEFTSLCRRLLDGEFSDRE